jgi:hypothetical protein
VVTYIHHIWPVSELLVAIVRPSSQAMASRWIVTAVLKGLVYPSRYGGYRGIGVRYPADSGPHPIPCPVGTGAAHCPLSGPEIKKV